MFSPMLYHLRSQYKTQTTPHNYYFFYLEAAWPSGQGAGLDIWRSRVQVPL